MKRIQIFYHYQIQLIRQCLSGNIPKIMTIDKWHHQTYSYYNGEIYGEMPSSYETYQLVADVLISKNKTHLKPKLKPNNHWSNWPNAGQL